MPFSPTTPSRDNLGRAGRDLDNTVSEQALDFDLNTALSAPVQAHINDPVGAHAATAISTTDTADHFATNQVEGNLQEIGATIKDTRWNGMITGGDLSVVGFTVTLSTPTKVLVNGNVRDYSGQSVVLPASQTRYLAITPTGNISSDPAPFNLSAERIYLWKIVTDGAGVISTEDMRLYVYDTDRKMPLTVQVTSPSTAVASAEGHFMSFEAALNFLDTFDSLGNTRKTLIIRGSNSITSTLNLPVDNLILQGDGKGSELVADAVLSPMINLAGRDDVQIKDLLLTSNAAGSTAISNGGVVENFVLENCKIVAGTGDWADGVSFSGAASPRATIRNCYIEATDYGIRALRHSRMRIVDCEVVEDGTAGVIGVSLGDAGTPGLLTEHSSVVRDLVVTGFGTGLFLRGYAIKVSQSTIFNSDVGIGLNAAGGAILESTQVQVNNTTGVSGIVAVSSDSLKISNTFVSCTRTVWGAEDPVGIDLTSSSNSTIDSCTIAGFDTGTDGSGIKLEVRAKVSNCIIRDCYEGITGDNQWGWSVSDTTFNSCTLNSINVKDGSLFNINGNILNSPGSNAAIYIDESESFEVIGNAIWGNSTSMGIVLAGRDASGERTRRFTVNDNNITETADYGIYLDGYVQNGTIDGNQIDGYQDTDPTGIGIYALTATSGHLLSDVAISNNIVWRWKQGIAVDGLLGDTPRAISITGNTVHHCATDDAVASPEGFTAGFGIGTNFCTDITVTGNIIDKIGWTISESDSETQPSAGGGNVYSRGILLRNTTRISVSGNTITTVAQSGTGDDFGIYFLQTDNDGAGTFTTGSLAIESNSITAPGEHGIYVRVNSDGGSNTNTLQELSVVGNAIDAPDSHGVYVHGGADAYLVNFNINSNVIARYFGYGIYVHNEEGSITDFSINDNTVRLGGGDCIRVFAALGAVADLERITINDNTLWGEASDPAQMGINLLTDDVLHFKSITINSNSINAAQNRAINLVSPVASPSGGNVEDLVVADNRITEMDTFGPAINVDVDGILVALSFTGNTIHGGTISGLQDGISINSTLLAVDTCRNITINDNYVGAFWGNGIYVATTLPCRNLMVQGNTLTGQASVGTTTGLSCLFSVIIGFDSIRGMDVSDNRFVACEEYGIELISTAGRIREVSFKGNSFRGCGTFTDTQHVIYVSAPARVDSLTFHQNSFRECNLYVGALNPATDQACIRLETEYIINNISVSNNGFEDCFGYGFRWITSGVGGAITDVDIRDNTFTTTGLADVYIDHANALEVTNVAFQNNLSNGCVGALGSAGSLYYKGPDTALLKHLMFTGNVINDTKYNGIVAHFSNSVRDVSLMHNTVAGCGVSGVWLEHLVGGAYAFTDLRVVGNSAFLCGATAFTGPPDGAYENPALWPAGFGYDPGSGFHIRTPVAGCKSWVISNNIARNNKDYGFWIDIGDASGKGGLTGDLENLVCTGNISTGNNTRGLVGATWTNQSVTVVGTNVMGGGTIEGVVIGNLDSETTVGTSSWDNIDINTAIPWADVQDSNTSGGAN